MELSTKVSMSFLFTFLALGGAVAQYSIWKDQSSTSMKEATAFYQKQNIDVNTYVHGMQFPRIQVENQRIGLDETFDPHTWVKVEDAQDGDIKDKVEIYGAVDNTQKGEYELRYVARNSYGLKSSKRIKVIVD